MMEIINPYREFVSSISPTEFEELSLKMLKGYAEKEHLSGFSIQHNVSITADDRTYQIDRDVMHIMNAAKPETEEQKRELYLMMDWHRRMPKYYAKEYADMDFPDRTIYPTSQMINALRQQFISAHPELILE